MSKIQGARPGDRANHIRVRLSPKEKAYLIAYAGDRTLSLIVREALINYGALPPNTPILDKRVERKLAKRGVS